MKRLGKNSKGITLISLVVTIIILIILSAITINLVLGENGIIEKSKETSLKQDNATIYEMLQNKLGYNYIDNKTNISGNQTSQIDHLLSNGCITSTADGYKVDVAVIIGNSLKTGNGSDLKDVYMIKVNDSTNEMNLIYYDKESNANVIGTLGILEETTHLPNDFWVITNSGEISVNKVKYFPNEADESSYYGYSNTDDSYDFFNIAVPKKVNNITVKSIATGAFSYIPISSVTIPNSIKTIGDSAFTSCGKLENVNILGSEVNVGNATFAGCSNLSNMIISGSLSRIGTSAFGGCSKLISITIPGNDASIGDAAFAGCSGLESVTILGESVSIGNGTFSGSSNLSNVTISGSISSIGISAFSNCIKLTSITIPGNEANIEKSAFSSCYGLKNVTILEGVKTIGDVVFSGCSELESITISSSVTSISEYIFSGCNKLTTINIRKPEDSILYAPWGAPNAEVVWNYTGE